MPPSPPGSAPGTGSASWTPLLPAGAETSWRCPCADTPFAAGDAAPEDFGRSTPGLGFGRCFGPGSASPAAAPSRFRVGCVPPGTGGPCPADPPRVLISPGTPSPAAPMACGRPVWACLTGARELGGSRRASRVGVGFTVAASAGRPADAPVCGVTGSPAVLTALGARGLPGGPACWRKRRARFIAFLKQTPWRLAECHGSRSSSDVGTGMPLEKCGGMGVTRKSARQTR